jgi:hypothetical protein
LNDGLEHDAKDNVQRKFGGLISSRFYLDSLALYHLAMVNYFEVGFEPNDPNITDGMATAISKQTFTELLLSPDPATGIQITAGTNIGIAASSSTFNAFISGAFRRDAAGEAYLESIDRIRNGKSVLDDQAELAASIDTYLNAMGFLEHYQPNLPAHLWGKRFRYHHGLDNPAVLNQDSETDRMQAEINGLRRKIDSLREELTNLQGQTQSSQ